MRIVSITVQNFQNIINKTTFLLSPTITRIGGTNAKGKSTIRRCLTLFADVHSNEEIKGLKPRSNPEAITTVELFLENKTSLTATLAHTLTPTFQLKDINQTILQSWNGYSDEILNILGWRLTDNGILLNFKKSKYNIAVDTNAVQTGEIVDYICRDIDIEERIKNLEEASKTQKRVSREIDSQLAMYSKEYAKISTINTTKLIALANQLHNLNNNLVNLQQLQHYLYQSQQIQTKQNNHQTLTELSQQLKQTCQYNYLQDNLHLHTRQQKLAILKRQKIKLQSLWQTRLAIQVLHSQSIKLSRINNHQQLSNLHLRLSKLESSHNFLQYIKSAHLLSHLHQQSSVLATYHHTAIYFQQIKQLKSLIKCHIQHRRQLQQLSSLNQTLSALQQCSQLGQLAPLSHYHRRIKQRQGTLQTLNQTLPLLHTHPLLSKLTQILQLSQTHQQLSHHLSQQPHPTTTCPQCNHQYILEL